MPSAISLASKLKQGHGSTANPPWILLWSITTINASYYYYLGGTNIMIVF